MNILNKLFGYKETHFDFIGKRKIFYIIALAAIIPGLVVMLISGLNRGIDFTGGTIIKIAYTEQVELADVREVASRFVVQTPSVNEAEDNQFVIRTEELEQDTNNAMMDALAELGDLDETMTSTDLIGPTIGAELLSNARWAILIAGILMLIYITVRFKFNFALTAIAALAHDVLVLLSFFAIFRIEVGSEFIAALLTIVGYSINNTIVIFDRIRENERLHVDKSYSGLINTSINQTLSRTINTVLAVLFLLFALLIFGGDTTKTFVLALIVGMFAGFFSSVFLVGNFLEFITNVTGKKHSAGRKKPVKVAAAKGR